MVENASNRRIPGGVKVLPDGPVPLFTGKNLPKNKEASKASACSKPAELEFPRLKGIDGKTESVAKNALANSAILFCTLMSIVPAFGMPLIPVAISIITISTVAFVAITVIRSISERFANDDLVLKQEETKFIPYVESIKFNAEPLVSTKDGKYEDKTPLFSAKIQHVYSEKVSKADADLKSKIENPKERNEVFEAKQALLCEMHEQQSETISQKAQNQDRTLEDLKVGAKYFKGLSLLQKIREKAGALFSANLFNAEYLAYFSNSLSVTKNAFEWVNLGCEVHRTRIREGEIKQLVDELKWCENNFNKSEDTHDRRAYAEIANGLIDKINQQDGKNQRKMATFTEEVVTSVLSGTGDLLKYLLQTDLLEKQSDLWANLSKITDGFKVGIKGLSLGLSIKKAIRGNDKLNITRNEIEKCKNLMASLDETKNSINAKKDSLRQEIKTLNDDIVELKKEAALPGLSANEVYQKQEEISELEQAISSLESEVWELDNSDTTSPYMFYILRLKLDHLEKKQAKQRFSMGEKIIKIADSLFGMSNAAKVLLLAFGFTLGAPVSSAIVIGSTVIAFCSLGVTVVRFLRDMWGQRHTVMYYWDRNKLMNQRAAVVKELDRIDQIKDEIVAQVTELEAENKKYQDAFIALEEKTGYNIHSQAHLLSDEDKIVLEDLQRKCEEVIVKIDNKDLELDALDKDYTGLIQVWEKIVTKKENSARKCYFSKESDKFSNFDETMLQVFGNILQQGLDDPIVYSDLSQKLRGLGFCPNKRLNLETLFKFITSKNPVKLETLVDMESPPVATATA